eukprot:CAMPEP_0117746066 /NCGR_PEP_ID=MMETSP0947-20121206/7738_1 /TAXON_ID=44440 /ORGANISM="Chattonella subsalsa, Strain CCMP2191" /LENGTH=219 /DNA_ID=CAMNT_0005563345 /DNA_START=1151 /DNA_END=1810 /DNA_ORIENTATION=+
MTWAMMISGIFSRGVKDNEICSIDCDDPYMREGIEMCQGDQSVSVNEYNEACEPKYSWWLLSFIISVFTFPYSTLLKFLVSCGFGARTLRLKQNICLRTCFCGLKTLGSWILVIFICLSIIWLVAGIFFFDGARAAASWLVGIAESWVYWFFVWSFFFLYKYRKDKKQFEEEIGDFKSVDELPSKIVKHSIIKTIKVQQDGEIYAGNHEIKIEREQHQQ